MRFYSILAVLSAPLLALAQNPNPFKIPAAGLSATAGQPLTLRWQPTTQGTVTLILRSGSSNNLNKGTVIASSIANSGSYTWTPAASITRGSDYAIEIVDDANPSQTNYTPYFVLESDNTVASTTPTVTLGASSTSITSQTGVQTSTSGSSGSSGSSMSSSSSGMTTSTGAQTTRTNGGLSPTGGASSSSGAAFQPTAQSTSSTGNAAPRATAAAGMLGLVALGALAL